MRFKYSPSAPCQVARGLFRPFEGPRWDLRSSADGGSARRPRRQLSQERSTPSPLPRLLDQMTASQSLRAPTHAHHISPRSGCRPLAGGCYVLDSIGAEGGVPTLRRRRIGGPTSAPNGRNRPPPSPHGGFCRVGLDRHLCSKPLGAARPPRPLPPSHTAGIG